VPHVALDELVVHGEAVIRVYRPLLGNEVADVTVGGEDLEILAQILLDRARLRGRFDDNQIFSHDALIYPRQKRKTAD